MLRIIIIKKFLFTFLKIDFQYFFKAFIAVLVVGRKIQTVFSIPTNLNIRQNHHAPIARVCVQNSIKYFADYALLKSNPEGFVRCRNHRERPTHRSNDPASPSFNNTHEGMHIFTHAIVKVCTWPRGALAHTRITSSYTRN